MIWSLKAHFVLTRLCDKDLIWNCSPDEVQSSIPMHAATHAECHVFMDVGKSPRIIRFIWFRDMHFLYGKNGISRHALIIQAVRHKSRKKHMIRKNKKRKWKGTAGSSHLWKRSNSVIPSKYIFPWRNWTQRVFKCGLHVKCLWSWRKWDSHFLWILMTFEKRA